MFIYRGNILSLYQNQHIKHPYFIQPLWLWQNLGLASDNAYRLGSFDFLIFTRRDNN
jgi:hypothetical protein